MSYSTKLEKLAGTPLVTCLCATKGRYELLRSAVTYFLLQDYPNKQLLIFNNHSEDIHLSEFLKNHHNIKLINAGEFDSIAEVYNTALTHVEDHSEFIAVWDDDDIYLPWHLSTGVRFLAQGTHWAWQPREQLVLDDGHERYPDIGVWRNYSEGCIIAKHSLIKDAGFGPNPAAADQKQHPHPQWTIELGRRGGMGHTEWPVNSYMYVWSDNNRGKPRYTHLSNGNAAGTNDQDTGHGKPLYPGPSYYDFVQKNLTYRGVQHGGPEGAIDEYTPEEKQRVVDRIDESDWKFYEERVLFAYWESKILGAGSMPWYVTRCINSIEKNSNCKFKLYDDESFKAEFPDIHPKFDDLTVMSKSDYIRNRVLAEKGGMYIDADMIVTGDLYEAFMKHTWDHDAVMATEDPNHTWNTIIVATLAARPNSETFKKIMRYVHSNMDRGQPHDGHDALSKKEHTVEWGGLVNWATKPAVVECTAAHKIKFLPRDVVSLRLCQSPHGMFEDVYKSPSISVEDIVTDITRIVCLHGSAIIGAERARAGRMPDEYILQRIIDKYCGDESLPENLEKSSEPSKDDLAQQVESLVKQLAAVQAQLNNVNR